ncbi:hypothetical protein [Streptomyces sp. NPDC003401]
MADKAPDLRLFATIPPPSGPDRCSEAVRGAATRAAAVGFSGTLVHSDDNTVDPWVVAREALSVAEDFAPPVAPQPLHTHPYAVAKKAEGALKGGGVRIGIIARDTEEEA